MKTSKNLLSNINLKQENLIQSLEGIGDILFYETKRQKNKLVMEGLQKIDDTVKNIFEIQEKEPERFEQLVVSQEFIELYKKDKTEAGLRLTFNPDKYLISFSTAINQITRVYDAAVNSQNEEISRFAIYHINRILAALSSSEKNGLFIEQILKKLGELARVALHHNDDSAYDATIRWYTGIVFERPNRGRQFKLSYLNMFDKYFFAAAKYIITENQSAIFYNLVTTLVDGIHVESHGHSDIWDYGHIILRSDFRKYQEINKNNDLEKRIKELVNSEDALSAQNKLESWLHKFNEIKAIILPNLNNKQKDEAKKIEQEITNFAASQFKYQNLLEIVFAIGSFCLFKHRYDYIKTLWEYKQPADSDASWIGHDIIPRSLDGVIRFYLRKDLFDRKFDFWEGHHGNEIYFKKYFLLLLAQALQNVRADTEDGQYSQIQNYQLPDLQIYRLSDLENSVDDFIQLSTALKGETELLIELGFATFDLDELFDVKLKTFLLRLKEAAQTQISAKHTSQNISVTRVKEFVNEFKKSFYENAVIRDIFIKYVKTYDNDTKNDPVKKERFGINKVDDKASLFDDWHVHYVGWGENYGESVAQGENASIIKKIASLCKEVPITELNSILMKFADKKDIVIFAANTAIWQFFEDTPNYKPSWFKDTKKLEIKGFAGWYKLKEESIPVFETFDRGLEKQILILNKKHLGKLMQFLPFNQGEDKNLLNDIFYINIRELSRDQKLMDEFISNPPEWLRKIAQDKQKEYLAERVVIQILERFEFIKDPDFKGYIIKDIPSK